MRVGNCEQRAKLAQRIKIAGLWRRKSLATSRLRKNRNLEHNCEALLNMAFSAFVAGDLCLKAKHFCLPIEFASAKSREGGA
jgi:hypothetical protein